MNTYEQNRARLFRIEMDSCDFEWKVYEPWHVYLICDQNEFARHAIQSLHNGANPFNYWNWLTWTYKGCDNKVTWIMVKLNSTRFWYEDLRAETKLACFPIEKDLNATLKQKFTSRTVSSKFNDRRHSTRLPNITFAIKNFQEHTHKFKSRIFQEC